MTPSATAASISLLVIYTEKVEECHEFYAALGMEFTREKHGSGPEHYAAVLTGGTVFEIYPTREGHAPQRLRFALALTAAGPDPVHRVLTDPDGRTVEVHHRPADEDTRHRSGRTSRASSASARRSSASAALPASVAR